MATNREKFYEKHGVPLTESLSLTQVAKLSKMPIAALKQVYEKGLGAHSTNPESVRMKGTFKKNPSAPISQKLSAPQWAMARVYSFVMKQKGTFYGADKHIAVEHGLLKSSK